MHRRFNWLISIAVGGFVGVFILWIMSSMVEFEPQILSDQPDRPVVQLIGTRQLCNEHFLELNQLIADSNSCQTDSDCELVMDSSLTFGNCFISVQSEQATLVSGKLRETGMNCRSSRFSACGHSTANAICKDNVCEVGDFDAMPRISLQTLQHQTMKSIDENLQ